MSERLWEKRKRAMQRGEIVVEISAYAIEFDGQVQAVVQLESSRLI